MKKEIRRNVFAVTLSLVLGACLAACGDATTSTESASSQKESTVESTSTDAVTSSEDVATSSEDAATSSETATTPTERKVLRLGSGDATNNELIDLAKVAQRQGYLEEELNKVGFTLEVTGFAGQGPEIIAAIASKSLDGGNLGEFPIYTSNATGIGTTAIAISDSHLAYSILTTNPEVVTAKDLEGKKVVVQSGTALYYVWEQIVAATGIDTSKVEVINSNVVDGISLVQTGDADAIVSSAISVSSLINKGLGHAVEDIPETVHSVTLIALSNSVLEEYPEVAVAINKALIRTYEFVTENPDEFFAIAGATYGDNGAAIAEDAYTIEGGLTYISPAFTDELYDYFDATYNWMKSNQLIAADVDVNKLFDGSYYEKAVEELK